jgi:hypothetical protein
MSAQHTPGPWRLDYPDGWGGAFVETIAPVADGRTALICSLYDRQSVFPPDDDEKEANGRLIAAAPAMFDVLSEIAELDETCELGPLVDQVRAVLRVASEGKA